MGPSIRIQMGPSIRLVNFNFSSYHFIWQGQIRRLVSAGSRVAGQLVDEIKTVVRERIQASHSLLLALY